MSRNTTIVPDHLKQQVENTIRQTLDAIVQGRKLLQQLPMPEIRYDLNSINTLGAAGYKGTREQKYIRIHPVCLIEATDAYLNITVVHETCHIADYHIRGMSNHDQHWKDLMVDAGAHDLAQRHNDNIQLITILNNLRKQKEHTRQPVRLFRYVCDCPGHFHWVKKYRHNSIQKQITKQICMYKCKQCDGYVRYRPVARLDVATSEVPIVKVPRCGTKLHRVYALMAHHQEHSRMNMINTIINDLNCSHSMAQTYYYKCKKILDTT